MQGLHYGGSHPLLLDYEESRLMKIAGSAFHGWCLASCLFSMLILLAEADADVSDQALVDRASVAEAEIEAEAAPDTADTQDVFDAIWCL